MWACVGPQVFDCKSQHLSQCMFATTRLQLVPASTSFPSQAVPCDLGKFGDFLSSHYIPNRVIVDCTASDAPASHYIDWMKQVRHSLLTRTQHWKGPGAWLFQVLGGRFGCRRDRFWLLWLVSLANERRRAS